jgi:hypothetical protein
MRTDPHRQHEETTMRKSLLAAVAWLSLTLPAQAEQFIMLIYESDAAFALRTDAEKSGSYWAAYTAYGKTLADAGVLRGGAPLRAGNEAITLRGEAGAWRQTAGAYAKAPGQLGGFFVIEATDATAAAALAAKAPSFGLGAVELRAAYPAPHMSK